MRPGESGDRKGRDGSKCVEAARQDGDRMTERHIQNINVPVPDVILPLTRPRKEELRRQPEGEDRMKGGLDLMLCGVNVCS